MSDTHPGRESQTTGAPAAFEGHATRPLTRITLRRTDDRDGRQRQVVARIDDGPGSTLMFGDECTVTVAPGSHVLKANNTLVWKTVPFNLEAGEHVEFQLINAPGRLTLGFLALLGVAPLYLSIEERRG